jgi:hypothetical protein
MPTRGARGDLDASFLLVHPAQPGRRDRRVPLARPGRAPDNARPRVGSAPMELLVYYAAQPVIPATWSHPALRAFITTELERSPFRRVWVYDLAFDSILWVHPSNRRGQRPGPR